ncbi:MAG TPA: sigma-70 family RNA polymerase sigma factor [Acidimicrobiales bacterium]|nr:sigma-70 family RNA polymerase sigma factor [Acidimicrobiales bacterium]
MYPLLRRRLEQIITTEIDAPAAVIEDACQIAWGRLLGHANRVSTGSELAWLVRTARREARRQLRLELLQGSLTAAAADEADVIELRPRSAPAPEQLEHRVRLASVASLPERQRRMIWLHAAGLSYGEIGAITGDSERTVERQLARGRSRLRELDAA